MAIEANGSLVNKLIVFLTTRRIALLHLPARLKYLRIIDK